LSTSSGIYRPSQWTGPALISVTVPQQTQQVTDELSTSSVDLSPSATGSVTYVFDAVLDLEHEQRLEKTRHPVQTGADISSHAYLMPARCVMYVLMSDAVDQYAGGGALTDGQPNYVSPWSGNPSKSVSAYQTMIQIQAGRQLLMVTTRLRTYNNMVITGVSPREDSKTITGLRMRVEFEEIYTAAVAQVPNSARSNTTDSTGLGQSGTQPVPTATQNQFGVPPVNPVGTSLTDLTSSLLGYLQSGNTVQTPGGGDYSCTNVNSLSGLPSPQ
jgi:hypothetical protein